MKKFEISTFLSLRECLALWYGQTQDAFDLVSTMSILGGSLFLGQLETMTGADKEDPADPMFKALAFCKWDSDESEWKIDERLIDALNMVSARYADNWAGWGEDEQQAARAGFDRYSAAIIGSWERFSMLLQSYTALKSKMLAPVKTTTKSSVKVKDTPQMEIDPFSNAYNAAVTANEGTAEEDRETSAGRLRELWEHYRAIIRDWSDEIGKVFLDHANI